MQYDRADNCLLTNLNISMYDYISRIFQLLKKRPCARFKAIGLHLGMRESRLSICNLYFYAKHRATSA